MALALIAHANVGTVSDRSPWHWAPLARGALSWADRHYQSRPQESEQEDKWSFCLTAGTLCPANQER